MRATTMLNYKERRRFLWILFLTGLLLLALAVMMSATTLARLHFVQLAQESTAVARLRCLDISSRWEQGEIWTDSVFEVLEREKGALPELVSVRMPGGRVGSLHAIVDGAPAFRRGEEVYLFLWAVQGKPYSVLGWSQGIFRITKNPQSGLETVTQDSAEMPIFDPHAKQFRREGIRNMPVVVFRERVWNALKQTSP